ncbi:MAG TPA: hypothetical protein VHW44_10915 [Pseudonocardiaceae bacterium]|jgi:hypothetical protein|nr:hypothetical protein [Pseudonocardiaceae bacterium]
MGTNWANLGVVAIWTVVATVALVALFGAGVVSSSRKTLVREQGGSGTAQLTSAIACFVLCVGIIGYGIFLFVSR